MLYFTLCSSSHRFWFGEYGGLRCCWCSYENWWRTIGEGVFLLISKISTSVSSLYNTIKCYWYSQLSSDEVWMFHFWVCTAFLTEGPLITCVNLKSLLFSFFGCVFSLLIYSFFQFPFFVFRFLLINYRLVYKPLTRASTNNSTHVDSITAEEKIYSVAVGWGFPGSWGGAEIGRSTTCYCWMMMAKQNVNTTNTEEKYFIISWTALCV